LVAKVSLCIVDQWPYQRVLHSHKFKLSWSQSRIISPVQSMPKYVSLPIDDVAILCNALSLSPVCVCGGGITSAEITFSSCDLRATHSGCSTLGSLL
jgi:hypothetical protein